MNTHARYIIGILAALLIATLAMKWNNIPDLPGLVNFAVGLSSLLLAVIAIFQTLNANTSADASLSSLRTASSEIAASATRLNEVAGQVLDTTRDNQASLAEIRTAVAGNANKAVGHEQGVSDLPNGVVDLASEAISYGGTMALYAAAKSLKSGKKLDLAETGVLKDMSVSTIYMAGYLSSLINHGFIKGEYIGYTYKIEELKQQEDRIITEIRNSGFKPEDIEEDIILIDKEFL